MATYFNMYISGNGKVKQFVLFVYSLYFLSYKILMTLKHILN